MVTNMSDTVEKSINNLNLNKDELWGKCLVFIKEHIQEQAYQTWFDGVSAINLNDEGITLQVPNQFHYEWLESKYRHLIDDALKENASDAKFYQASASEMFGNSPGIKNENSAFKPRSPYGTAKVFAHQIANHYREAYNIFACCGILFNHESPLRGIEFVTRRITWNLARIKSKKTKNFTLGNIYAKRDWGFAGDYVESMWQMLQQDKPDDYVVATGESHSVEEFLTLASEYAGLGDWHDFVKIDEFNMRPTDIDELTGDSSKARKKLGWKPKMEFNDLVKHMVYHDMDYFKNPTV